MSAFDEEIDAPAGSVLRRSTDQVLSTSIIPFCDLDPAQRGEITAWRFDWLSEASHVKREVAALLVETSTTPQGLISLEPAGNYVLIHLLESAPHNVGQNKLYRGVAANLFAFACARSFALKFQGYVGFEAKTALIEHYKVSLGAEQVGSSSRMILGTDSALQLMKHYYKEMDQWPL